ncbi:MAG: hypothetical protein IJP97_01450 [Synergistaceae bacterium]|nr:hypothetical protein [Synergistaceae bacterium]
MKARKVLSFIIAVIAVCISSCAYANISPDVAAEDPRIKPFISATKENGAELLPGRYVQLYEIQLKDSEEKINAPSHIIIEIGQLDSESGYYPSSINVYGKDIINCWMLFDASEDVPVLRTYTLNAEGKYEVSAEAFAVVMADDDRYGWFCGNLEDGHVSYLLPVNEYWFPKGWYEGAWSTEDGKYSIAFSNGELYLQDKPAGKFAVTDNRIMTTESEIIYAMYEPQKDILVVSFTTNTGYPEEALIFKRELININGTWAAIVNGQQWVIQYDNGQYNGWINGMPAESGVYEINGDVIAGRNSNGVNFEANIKLDPTGNYLLFNFPDGSAIQYERMQ